MCISPININGVLTPCGHCVECSMQYQNSLAIRCNEESKDWNHTYSITLTYDEEHCPYKDVYPFMVKYLTHDDEELVATFGTLKGAERFVRNNIVSTPIIHVFDEVKSYLERINNPKATAPYQVNLDKPRVLRVPTQRKGDFQTFIKSLRKSLDRGSGEKVKYLYSSEYGENTWRCHYHCILFTNMPFEEVKPLVDHYWTNGYAEMHEVKDVYKGNYCTKQAAFMYASKYVVKPTFLMNPLEKLGVVDPCFRSWSKGLGKSYRTRYKDKATKLICKIENELYSPLWDGDSKFLVKYYDRDRQVEGCMRVPKGADMANLCNKDLLEVNGVKASKFKDLFELSKYNCVGKKNVFSYSLPRYFKEIIKPKHKVKENVINYETGEMLEKIFTRVDDKVLWYQLYQMFVQYLHIQDIYRDGLVNGKIDLETEIGEKIRYVRTSLGRVDAERIRESYKKAYKHQAFGKSDN